MYETIHEAASSLSLLTSLIGLAVSAIAVHNLGTWTLGPATLFKGVLNLLYLAAILALLFFVYSVGINASA